MADNVNEMIKTILEAQIVQALNNTPDAIGLLVKIALSKEVDEKTGSYKLSDYHSKMVPYLDYICGEEIRRAAEGAVRRIIDEQREKIESKIREALTGDDIIRSMVAAFIKTADREWEIQVNFEAKKEKRY